MSGGMRDELVHREVLSPNHGTRTLPISMVVIHYTEMKPVEAAIARMCDPASSVSAHYCITEAGEVIRLVPEDRRAWHAGASYWRGSGRSCYTTGTRRWTTRSFDRPRNCRR